MKISELSDDERREYLDKAYQTACDLCGSGDLEAHPSRTIMDWVRAGRARDKARDEGGLGPVEIENKRKPGNDDLLDPASEPEPELTAGGNGGNGGAEPTIDGCLSVDSAGVPRFESADGRTILTGDAAIAVRQSNPGRVRRVAAAIKGYDRLK